MVDKYKTTNFVGGCGAQPFIWYLQTFNFHYVIVELFSIYGLKVITCTNHDNDEANEKETRRWRNVLTKAKKVMSFLVEIILILNRSNPHPNPEIHDINSLYQLSYSDLDEVFKLAHEELMSSLYPQFTAEQRNSRLINYMSYVTVYDRLMQHVKNN
jgi:hypothetical protein